MPDSTTKPSLIFDNEFALEVRLRGDLDVMVQRRIDEDNRAFEDRLLNGVTLFTRTTGTVTITVGAGNTNIPKQPAPPKTNKPYYRRGRY